MADRMEAMINGASANPPRLLPTELVSRLRAKVCLRPAFACLTHLPEVGYRPRPGQGPNPASSQTGSILYGSDMNLTTPECVVREATGPREPLRTNSSSLTGAGADPNGPERATRA